jgi:hypothetical protein
MFEIYKDDLLNDIKSEKKFLSSCKRMLRTSYEYSEWSKYIKFKLGIDSCAFTNESSEEVTIEIHHHPISVENIIRGIYDKKLLDVTVDVISSVVIVGEAIRLHLENRIGYIPLVTTLHEKFHNGFLSIPIEYVSGNWNYLLEKYTYSKEAMEVIDRYKSINKFNNPYSGWLVMTENQYLTEHTG